MVAFYPWMVMLTNGMQHTAAGHRTGRVLERVAVSLIINRMFRIWL